MLVDELFKLNFGDKVRDKVTKFEGTVMARIENFTGVVEYSVTPEVDDIGSMRDAQWVEESRLEVLGSERIGF